ncbi:Minichromosome loss protein Mcl1, middle region [Dillenia turbinata]|uniref:Minichromosome loss protein Mcl1, middle region n=1 Tax=Dillenia turbinata TaxID=194707 RepID=A0AAN8Z532_9MAGN
MKGRTLKLKEAHKNNGVSSFCSVLWDNQASYLITASGSDSSICIHDALLTSSPPKMLRHHRDGVTALALSPNSTCLASGSVDHSVKLYKFPSGEFETNITRFTLPIRALTFNKSGSMLAAAGDDEGIKLINTVDGSIARVLKGHRGSVTALAFDPNGEYLASIDSTGTVIFWELQSGRTLHNLKGISPDTGVDYSMMNILSWSPDGETLAVPGWKNDVVMYDRDTAEKLFALRGDHVQPICFLSWSPNGKYMATSGLDRQVLIWDVEQRQDLDRQVFEERISYMAWKPNGNALAVIDVMGKYGVWESPVPSSMKSPTDGAQNLHKNSNGLLLFDEDEEEKEPSMSGGLSDLGEDSHGESEPPKRKRLHKQAVYDENSDDDANDELSFPIKAESCKRARSLKREPAGNGVDTVKSSINYARPSMQEAFQPGATPLQPGRRRFLCYNMLGSITTIEHEGYSHIELDFHDSGIGPRVPAMTDYFGFTMASLNENGSVFANPCKGEKNMSTLMYRPFSSWANNSEWSMRFEEEEVKVVALGMDWVAAITSLNFLRIFTVGGLQRHILSLDGPVVTASGFNDEIAIVTHASHSLPSNDQMLEYRVLNVRCGTQTLRGHLPLTPGSSLMWFGFSEEGRLSSYDSKGVLRVFTEQFGGSWLPLFSGSKEKKSEENYWVVGVNASKLISVVCKYPETFPQVTPKPVLTLLDLAFPLASSDLGAETLENEFILVNMHITQIQQKMEAVAAAGQDTTALDDEAFSLEAALDRCILRLIASCCNADKLVRATELVKLLSMEKSVKGAIKLVTALKLPNLAERFNSILEERLLNESNPVIAQPAAMFNGNKPIAVHLAANSKPEASDMANTLVHKPSTTTMATTTTESCKTPEPVTPLSAPKLSAPIFKKKKSQQGPKIATEAAIADKKVEEVKDGGDLKKVVEKTPPGVRPTNPFAKSASNQEKTSLLDSIKKMKNENTSKT